ncbi:MAG: amino acid ABC transporter permease [SAR324 cluster bacterium]|nr:amino acid ABC transporter permease [SAR324 cluster bacterium]
MSTSEFQSQPDRPPPNFQTGWVKWFRDNLFSSPFNTFLTIVAVYLLYLTLPWILQWAIFEADWVGTTREACETTDGQPRYGIGACWVFISVRFNQIIYGFYPPELQWRPNIIAILLIVLLTGLLLKGVKHKQWIGAFTLIGFPIIAGILIHGGLFGLEVVDTDQWGGLMLTLILSWVGIIASLPIGTALALGRRSQMPIVRTCSIVYIEFWRGVPLITVLFMASVMLPLFLPEGTEFDKLIRCFIGIVLFQSAYMAEVVRGGLQAIPKGQYEAADALGLSYWEKMNLIVLPQALKIVIPGIVNTFIALFKDTTLVYIVGLIEMLHILQIAGRDSEWIGFDTEGYVFAALLFWIFCYSMSHYSQSLEKKLHTGHKR